MVWFAFALMTVAAALCVGWPLVRPRRDAATGATDVVFYREQISELDADVERGLFGPADVDGARAELGRRLISASESSGAAPTGRRHNAAAAAAVALVLVVAGGLYAAVGHPGDPDAPLAARLTGRTEFAEALAKIEAHLVANPDDGVSHEVVAPVYLRLGRYDDAIRSYREAVRVLGASPDRRAALGQALVLAADGVVTGEARQIFDGILRDDPLVPQARFFDGLAAMQDGDKEKARGIWQALVREAPPQAPYIDMIRGHLAALDGGAAPPLTTPSSPRPVSTGPMAGAAPALAGPGSLPGMPAGAAAVAALPADQQALAIRGMVDGLAARLGQDGRDAEGWLRLVRAYRVLGEPDKAVKALADARRSMTGDPGVLARLDQLAHELGLEG